MKLTKEEKQAIKQLEEVAKNWPSGLWLFSASGILHVIKKLPNGKRAMSGEGFDPNYSVAIIDITNDGGDW